MSPRTNYVCSSKGLAPERPKQDDKKAKPREDLSAVAGLFPSETVCKAVTSFGSPESDIHLVQNIQGSVNAENLGIKSCAPKLTLSENAVAIFGTISDERLSTYMSASGHNPGRALELYMWNARVGGAFHTLIQATEVGLRNCINHALKAQFGHEWWKDDTFSKIVDDDRKIDIDQVLRRIRNRKLPLGTGQVVAGLSFGFWVGLLDGRYNPPLWGKHLRSSFPHLPVGRSRKSLDQSARDVATLRNRISHHEPLIKRDISKDYSNVTTLLSWICPITLTWARGHCGVPELLRNKP